ncbi:MAG TPA: RNA methyltransferase [Spirochaetales bacterium]|nr:RNA methyltransferase [Spirochaetales bacterium]HQG40195.1 RNA methyltransferase [Spirochaetales bacterium]HQK34450.1 RNA methyltransferase [Spirochaetales bacterium]
MKKIQSDPKNNPDILTNTEYTPQNNRQRIPETPVCSREAVKALAARRPHCIRRLFMDEQSVKEFGELCSYLAREHKLYRIAREDELQKLSGTVHHQGVVAMIEDTKLQPLSVEDAQMLNKSSNIILLDDIGDDHNIGAIARTAAFFGFDSIILTGNKTKLTPGMYRVARGGIEYLSMYYAESAASIISACPHQLKIAAAAHGGRAINEALKQFAYPVNHTKQKPGCILVLGNEEHGLSQEALAACPIHVTIQGKGTLESLNVTQAAAILMNELISWLTRSAYTTYHKTQRTKR